MKRTTKLVIALGTALTLGLGAMAASGHPSQGYGQGYGMGPGMMGGQGQGWAGGHMGGYGQGYGMGPGMMGGQGQGQGQGWAGGHMGGYGQGHGMGPGMMGGQGQGWGGGHMGGCGQGAADEGLAALKAELGISDQQDAAWQAFAANAKQQNESRRAWFAKMHQAPSATSAPELFAQRAEMMQQRQVEMLASTTALKSLYETLTPEQKLIADRRFGGF